MLQSNSNNFKMEITLQYLFFKILQSLIFHFRQLFFFFLMLNEIFPGILKNGKQNHSASNYLIFKIYRSSQLYEYPRIHRQSLNLPILSSSRLKKNTT